MMSNKSGFYLLLILVAFNFVSGQEQHKLFTGILQKYVRNGLVDYAGLKSGSILNGYMDFLNKTDPDTISGRNEKLAFWINAYNAFTLKVITDHYPVKSINDLHTGGRYLSHVFGTTIWHKKIFKINGKEISLNTIEHEIIRKEFSEPGIHFALVCAAVSCPPLRNEAYEGFKLAKQLNDQAKIFFNDSSKNKFDMKTRTAWLSKIMDWYDDDFGNSNEEILLYISKFLPAKLAQDIRDNTPEWEINYFPYNWDLNDLN